MSADRPRLTTAELQKATADATRFCPSVYQLGDWVAAGLLPPSRPGRGRGRAVGGSDPRLWEAECLPRLILIAQSRTGKNISVPRAAARLAAEGYLLGPKHLRDLLAACLFDLQAEVRAPLEQNRRYLTRRDLSAAEKRQRFHRSELRRYGGGDPRLRARVEQLKLILLGVSDTSRGGAIGAVLGMFTYEEVNASLRGASDEEITGAFEQLGQALPFVVSRTLGLYAMLLSSGDAVVASYGGWEGEALAQVMQALREVVQDGPDALAAGLRLPLTLALLHLRARQVEGLDETLVAAYRELVELLTARLEEGARAAFQAMLMGVLDGSGPSSPKDGGHS
jgi:hypothetical protein